MHSTAQSADVAVIGAGLTGSSVALDLAQNGLEVVLIDQDEVPVNRASLRNEGKIHLGFVYAVDTSLATARIQLKGALSFRRLLQQWVGDAIYDLPQSTPFHYLVADDSIVPAWQIERHFQAVEACFHQELARSEQADYLGARPGQLFRRLSGPWPGPTAARFETVETAVDTDVLATLVREAVAASPNVEFLPGRRVTDICKQAGNYLISGWDASLGPPIMARQVVNAAWDGRLALDKRLGLEHRNGWLYRLKFRSIIRIPEALRGSPSLTIVTGKYGDLVVRANDTAYLSWYPVGMKGWSTDLAPPVDWAEPSTGRVQAITAREVFEQMREGISPWVPDITASEPLLVDAGVIVAQGRTDIDDPASGLHARTHVGVRSDSGYHSVNPGKLTAAPLFAAQASRRVTEVHVGRGGLR